MSSIELEKHLAFELKPSKMLLWITSAINLLAVVVIVSLSMGLLYKLLLFIMVCANFVVFLQKYGWLNRFRLVVIQPIVQIRYQGDNNWQLRDHAGSLMTAKLKGSSFSGLNIVILIFKISDVHWLWRRLSVVIFKDSIDPVSFRHLRIHLRLTVNPI